MKTVYLVPLIMFLVIAVSNQSQAQNSPYQDSDSFGTDDYMSWDISLYQRNVWDSGEFFDSIENHYFRNDKSSEPIDEIIVTAKLRAAHRMFLADLWSQLDLYFLMELRSRQESECESIQRVDPGTHCLNETNNSACLTSTFTVPGLTSQQAWDLNTQYTILQNTENSGHSFSVGVITAILTGGMAEAPSVVYSLLAATGSYVGGLPDRADINPFRQGDSFVLEMTACPSGGFGEVPNFSTTVTYTGG
jgi:hypothetical protein